MVEQFVHLPGNLLMEAGYVGSHGLHLTQTGEGTANLNQLTADQLKAVHPDSAHDFPLAAREEAYQFIDRVLRK